MALARARRGRYQANYWPGFVDMLSTLLLVVTFLMSLFMLSNFVVTQATSGKDTMLSRLNRQLAELTELLALERSKKESVEDNLAFNTPCSLVECKVWLGNESLVIRLCRLKWPLRLELGLWRSRSASLNFCAS